MGSEFGPLRILILEGEGLQATSTLLNLDSHLKATANRNGGGNPRPCDVFDCIAGTGMGGWLAILLGRFRMDITSCLAEWFKIVQDVLPISTTEMLRMKCFHQYHLFTDRLLEHVNHLTKIYNVGENLLETDPEGARTRHVFVAALKSDKTGYGLFRTYEISTTVENLCEGPKDPINFTISRAFSVSGTTSYLTYPVTEQMETSGHTEFKNTNPLKRHNIPEIALDEISAIYGKKEPLPIVTSIGPDHTNEVDEEWTTGGCFCGVSKIAAYTRNFPSREKSTNSKGPPFRDQASSSNQPVEKANNTSINNPIGIARENIQKPSQVHSRQSQDNLPEQDSIADPSLASGRPQSDARVEILESVKEPQSSEEMRERHIQVASDVNPKLKNQDLNHARLHLPDAPINAPQKATQHNSPASSICTPSLISVTTADSDQSMKRTEGIEIF